MDSASSAQPLGRSISGRDSREEEGTEQRRVRASEGSSRLASAITSSNQRSLGGNVEGRASGTSSLSPLPAHRRRRREPSPPLALRAEEGSRGDLREGETSQAGGVRAEALAQETRTSTGRGSEQRRPTKRRRAAGVTMRPDGTAVSSLNGSGPLSNGSSPSPSRKAVSNSLNGHGSIQATNGAAHHANGAVQSPPQDLSSNYYGHDRGEVTRILIQSLLDLGYTGAAGQLSRESGYELESPSVAAYRNAILEGEWNEAELILLSSHPPDGGGVHIGNGLHKSSRGIVLAEGADRSGMLFLMRQQKFLELLENRDVGTALMVLRQELRPLGQSYDRLHFLAG